MCVRVAVLLIMCFYLPLRLSFLADRVISWPGDAWLVALDVLYMFDIAVGMSTAYYDYLGNLEVSACHVYRPCTPSVPPVHPCTRAHAPASRPPLTRALAHRRPVGGW